MKIIDLLNKIANGEETPNKIKFDNTIWNKRCGEINVYYEDDTDSDLFIYVFRRNLTFTLNDEIEIIEDNKIENIDLNIIDEDMDLKILIAYLRDNNKLIEDKTNEIIDKVNEMSDNNE